MQQQMKRNIEAPLTREFILMFETNKTSCIKMSQAGVFAVGGLLIESSEVRWSGGRMLT